MVHTAISEVITDIPKLDTEVPVDSVNLFGIIPPVVTPFDSSGHLDPIALRHEARYLIEKAHVHGLAVCGSTGEGHTLSTDETREIAGAVVEEARHRIPVICGIITDSTPAAVERAKAVADLGVAALQVTPVHYLFRPDDDSMLAHFDTIAQKSGLPVIIYNVVPWCYLSPSLLVHIFQQSQGVIGVKQIADMKALADLLLLVQESGAPKTPRVLSAVDALLYPSFVIGAHGAVAAILSAAPERCVALWSSVQESNHERAVRLHAELLRLWHALDAPNLPANVKTAIRLQGREAGLPRQPMPCSSPVQVDAIRRALKMDSDSERGRHGKNEQLPR